MLRLRKISGVLRGSRLEFYTGSGVFSPKRIDTGSELLANKCAIKGGWRVLDLGCGYGAVGIAVARAFPSVEVVMADINRRAVSLALMNIKLNRLKNASASQSDIFSGVSGNFDAILLNPPQSAGKKLCIRMISESRGFLRKNGVLQVVARHNKGGKSLKEAMACVFGNAEDVAIKSGYRVYASSLR